MRPLFLLALAVACTASAGQIEAPVSGEFKPGAPAGAIGSALGSPTPIQLSVPALTGGSVPNLASALAAAPVPTPGVQPLAVQASAAKSVPVLPKSAIAPVKATALTEKLKTAPSVAETIREIDMGRVMFDQSGAPKPEGVDRAPGKALDPNLLPTKIYSPEIMRAARESGAVFEVDAASLKKMKPGVRYNFVIAENPNGRIVMTLGRLPEGEVEEVGVKHVALGDGRKVPFSGGAMRDPVTGRPALDFNSGMYSEIGFDENWAPTPKNAGALSAYAEAILGTQVDIVDHFTGRRIEFGRGAPEPLRSVKRGASRSEGWVVDGKPGQRLSAGGFKEVLIHPSNYKHVIKLFSLLGADDAAGSLAGKRLEMRNLEPLLAIGRTPKIFEHGAVELETPSGKKVTGYLVQERVEGRELGAMLDDRAVAARALKEVRALFEDLIAARIKLEDRVKMHENIRIDGKAWVLDAGEASRVPAQGTFDRLRGRPDPLRVYYEGLLAEYSRRAGI